MVKRKLSSEVEAAIKKRDAEWRDALRGNFAPDFWKKSGPQNPEDALIFKTQWDRVDDEHKQWLIKRYELAVEDLELRDTCVKCGCSLHPPEVDMEYAAPHCIDTCNPDDDQRSKWLEARLRNKRARAAIASAEEHHCEGFVVFDRYGVWVTPIGGKGFWLFGMTLSDHLVGDKEGAQKTADAWNTRSQSDQYTYEVRKYED
jgi:hypothetical protein